MSENGQSQIAWLKSIQQGFSVRLHKIARDIFDDLANSGNELKDKNGKDDDSAFEDRLVMICNKLREIENIVRQWRE